MEVNSHDSKLKKSSNLNSLIKQVIHFQKFSEALNESSNSPVSSIIKIGDLSYKVDVPLHQPKNISKESDKKNENTKNNKSDDNSESNLDQTMPFFYLDVQPIDQSKFLGAIDQSLRSFIHEIVAIIKDKKVQAGENKFIFKFKGIPLEIAIDEIDAKLAIRITTHGELKELFSDHNKQALLDVLKQTFPNEDIDLMFMDTGSSSDSEQSQQDQDGQESEPQNQDSNEPTT